MVPDTAAGTTLSMDRSMGVTSSRVRPPTVRALLKVDSEEEPELKAMVLPFRSATLWMPLSGMQTTLSTVWTELGAKMTALPRMHRR